MQLMEIQMYDKQNSYNVLLSELTKPKYLMQNFMKELISITEQQTSAT